MSIRRPFLVWLSIMFLRTYTVNAQLPGVLAWEEKVSPGKLLCMVQKRSAGLAKRLSAQSVKYAARIKKEEAALFRKLKQKDSALSQTLTADNLWAKSINSELLQQANLFEGLYVGRLDSLTVAVQFLQSQTGLSGYNSAQLQQTLADLDAFKNELEKAQVFKEIMHQRSSILLQQAQRLGMLKEMRRYSKELFYYRAQVERFKQMFESPNYLELKLLEVVSETPQFKKFFAANAQLARMFALPDPGNVSTPSLEGMQTVSSVGSLLADRFGAALDMESFLPTSQKGSSNQLKNNLEQFTEGQWSNGQTEREALRQFKPNEQKIKSFGERLELGANFQSQRSSQYFPVTSNIALHLGYKLNNKSIIGIGAAYKMGWGNGWNNMRISHQGIGIRSFLDWQLKGNIYISGGYEQNYHSAFNSISILKKYSAWQSSGLIGFSRKFKSGKHGANMQLLWDFLADRQVPQSQPLVWRVGYSLK